MISILPSNDARLVKRTLRGRREAAKLRPWLLQIARNRASEVIVRRRRESPLETAESRTSLYGTPATRGAITLENVPPGRATLLLSVQLDRDQSAGKVVHRDIDEGETLVETMDFTAGANITGEVLQGGAVSAEFGRLVAGTLERAVESSEDLNELYRWTLHRQRIGPGGTFRFGAVEPGTYTVVVLDGDASVIAQQTVTVADTDIDVKVRVP